MDKKDQSGNKTEVLAEPLTGKTVLIVDDEAMIRTILVREFTSLGCTTLEADNSKSAFNVMKDHAVDVIISDVQMPGGDGIDLLTTLGPESKSKGFVIVMISGFSRLSEEQAQKYGAIGMVPKPFSKKKVSNFIRAYFSKETSN